MDEEGCSSSGVWKFLSDISLEDVFIPVYYWDYLQVGLCAVAYHCSTGVDWYFDQIEDLQIAYRPNQMVLSRFWISMENIHDELDDIFQE